MSGAAPAHGNQLLAALSAQDAAMLAPALQQLMLRPGQCIVKPGQAGQMVVFPETALLGVYLAMRDGREVQTQSIGEEGACNLLQAFAPHATRERVAVQVGGLAYQLSALSLAGMMQRSPSLTRHVSGALHETFAQASQAAACAALHTVRERMCRWLADSHVRAHQSRLRVTHEDLSVILAVQRTTVTKLAAELRDAGMISYRRSYVTIADYSALAAAACECHAVAPAPSVPSRASFDLRQTP